VKKILLLLIFLPFSTFVLAQDTYVGEIQLVPFNFAMKGWANCSGQLLSISSNTALFNLLGTTYGGDGRTTFALPDFNGRVAVGQGTSSFGETYSLGQSGGEAAHSLTTAEMPAHTHSLAADSGTGAYSNPSGKFVAKSVQGVRQFSPTANANMNPLAVTGSGLPHNNMMPYLGLKYVIALQGIYPAPSVPLKK
jgi:microcystin-dependent protein